MKVYLVVEAELERTEGLFASRDELADQLKDEVEGADPGSVEGSEGGQYDVASWEAYEVTVERGRELMAVTPAERRHLEERRILAARRRRRQ